MSAQLPHALGEIDLIAQEAPRWCSSRSRAGARARRGAAPPGSIGPLKRRASSAAARHTSRACARTAVPLRRRRARGRSRTWLRDAFDAST
jgi:hypothetical protein